jgi:hypothetical protein
VLRYEYHDSVKGFMMHHDTKLKYGDWKSKEIQFFVDGWGRAFLSEDKSNVRGSIPRSLAPTADMLTLRPPRLRTRTAFFELFFI